MAKIDSRIDCEQVTSSTAAAMNRSTGRSRSSVKGFDRDRAEPRLRCAALLLSGRMNATSAIASTLRHADTVAGRAKFAVLTSFPASTPPMAGPTVNPMPIAAPISPSEAARLRGSLTSDAYANAAAMLPAMNPPRTREAISHQTLLASPRMT